MPTITRVDTTDPRRHDKVKPLKFPASWLDDNVDVYGFLLSSSTMVSGMAMVTRLPQLAYLGLICSLANYAHEKPFQAKKESAASAAGPVMGLLFAIMSIILITMQKLMGSLPLHQQIAVQREAAATTKV